MTAMKSRWVILQHVEWEGPGIIAREAEKRGFEVDFRRLDRGDKIPDADHIDGLVAMGGPLGAYEEDRYPFLAGECDLLAKIARRDSPVLGVCLGAQILAKALGATVYPGPEGEIGFGSIELTAAGRLDPLFACIGDTETVLVFHWHGDTFTLPEGAVLLGSSPMYAHQAFRFGTRAYGLQFHVEPDTKTWLAWRDHLPEGLIDGADAKRKEVERIGKKIISSFFDLATKRAAKSRRPQAG